MNCYNCGGVLSDKDFCTRCMVDVSKYKKVIYLSNFYYNKGLEEAKVRDLSGAIVSLRQSLKFNKNNVEARNLLGLIYYEIGEIVPALSEWVISKNIRPKKNIADDYLGEIQTDQTKFQMFATIIRKYNQALLYCQQGSTDLAIIQLKKVLTSYGNYLKARLLLALLYINSKDFERAKREIEKVLRIDVNNTVALRYRLEIQEATIPLQERTGMRKKEKALEDVVSYQSGNETIIQPTKSRERRASSVILALAAGICIGIALVMFLIMPAQISDAQADANEQVQNIGEELTVKNSEIVSLTSQVESLQSEYQKAEDALTSYKETDSRANELLQLAVEAYVATPEQVLVIADYLDQIDEDFLLEDATEVFHRVYNGLIDVIGEKASEEYYLLGTKAFDNLDYETAIIQYAKSYKFDPTNADALFNLGSSYEKNGNTEQALEIYNRVITLFEGSRVAGKAEEYISSYE